MTITYTWTITGLECVDPDADDDCDTIKTAYWTLDGIDGANNLVSIPGKTALNITMDVEGQTAANTFAAVTESEIIDAVQHALGTEHVDDIKTNIDANLTRLATPAPVLVT